MENALDDELMSINSIYEEGTLSLVDEDKRICTLNLSTDIPIKLRVEFPSNYPDAPPAILGTESIGSQAPKGMGNHAVDIARVMLSQVYNIGEPVIYDLVEELIPLLNSHFEIHVHEEDASFDEVALPLQDLGPAPSWIITATTIEKKSLFVARCASVSSLAEAKQKLAHLLATDKRVAKATHNITAWRIRGEGGTAIQDCDDDGETAAGSRMLKLLQVVDVWDVMVVVSRWYGGVKLGPDRFRLINNVAREVLVMGGFIVEDGKKKR
jgi:hypothetical protein